MRPRHEEDAMMDEHDTKGEGEREHNLPRTTTTGDDEQDYRGPGDSSVQLTARDDPREADPDSTRHSEDDDLLPDVEEDRDEEQEELGDIERPASNLTDRPYGEP
jgi:hypothetical protein